MIQPHLKHATTYLVKYLTTFLTHGCQLLVLLRAILYNFVDGNASPNILLGEKSPIFSICCRDHVVKSERVNVAERSLETIDKLTMSAPPVSIEYAKVDGVYFHNGLLKANISWTVDNRKCYCVRLFLNFTALFCIRIKLLNAYSIR